jgi:ribosomal-protein-alanine N-acetyltransferase
MSLLLDGKQTDRLAYRKIQLSDSDAWLEFFRHPNTHKHWVSQRSTPEEECSQWYARQQERYDNDEGGMNALIDKSTGKLVGHCGLLRQTVDGVAELEIGYSVLPEFWNKGYASEAAIACRDHAFQNKLSSSLISIISVTNTASENVARKVGMKIEKVTMYKGNKVNIFRVQNYDLGD